MGDADASVLVVSLACGLFLVKHVWASCSLSYDLVAMLQRMMAWLFCMVVQTRLMDIQVGCSWSLCVWFVFAFCFLHSLVQNPFCHTLSF